MKNKILALITVLFLTSCFEEKEIKIINAVEQNKDLTLVNFQESAQKEVLQDVFKANLKIEISGGDVIALQNIINTKMQEGVKIAKEMQDLTVSTGNYNVNKRWDQNLKQYVDYQAFQEIILDSKNKENLLKVAQELQKLGFIMSNLQSYLSVEKRASHQDELIEEALNRVKNRANLIAKNLEKEKINIAQININSNNYRPYFSRAVQTLSLSKETMATPVLEPSKQEVLVEISVTVNLED